MSSATKRHGLGRQIRILTTDYTDNTDTKTFFYHIRAIREIRGIVLKFRYIVVFAGLVFVTSLISSYAADVAEENPNTLYGVAERIRGFDPVMAGDVASALAISRIYEGLLQYSYLARPYQVEPGLAEKMPEISADGLTYTFTIRKGIFFQDDACFTANGGKGRELTADDFVYSIKRTSDIKTGSTGYWAFNGRIVGLDEFRAKSGGEQPTDYSLAVAGLSAPERYTLRIRLNMPYPQLLWILTMHYAFAVPREAVEFYGKDFVNHPVGTGPYCLKSWRRNYRIEYVRNPKWRQTNRVEKYPVAADPGDIKSGLLADAGKPIPFMDRIVQYFIGDSTTLWFMFLKGQTESSSISRDNWDAVITSEKTLNNELTAMGIKMYSSPVMETYYIGFNMEDPVVGANKYLRQALACAFNTEPYVRFFNNRVIRASGPIPPGIAGFEKQAAPYPFDLTRAAELLAKAGYPEGKDPQTGRRLKLSIDIGDASNPEVRASVELFSSFMEKIGVQIAPIYNNWPTFLARLERRQAQMFRLGWVADYPDAENFLQLFYGPNCSPGPNHSNYRNAEFDKLYEQVRVMNDSPERTALYRKMADIVTADCPWIYEQHPLAYGLHHHWLKNYKPHDFPYGMNKYHAVDFIERARWKEERGLE
jgi:oligopeptide transport system substrate-binding protein